jgi:hypothetical protein
MTYPSNWNEIAKAVKDEAGWKCVRCGAPHDVEAGYCLTVHHLDGDPSNCAWWNLPALCQRCHLSVQGRVKMEQGYALPHSRWFLPYVAGYYARVEGVSATRSGVEANLVRFLAMGQSALRDYYAELLC